MLREFGTAAAYAAEAAARRRILTDHFGDYTAWPESVSYVSRMSALSRAVKGAAGMMFYDMSVESGGSREERLEIGKHSSAILALMAVSDDAMDECGMTLEEKNQLLDTLMSDLFGNTRGRGGNPAVSASRDLACAVRSNFFGKYGRGRMEHMFERLVRAEKCQLVETDEQYMIGDTGDKGGAAMEILVEVGNIVTRKIPRSVYYAAAHIGACAQYIDDACDIDTDIRFGINTYPTLIIRRQGDNPDTRMEVTRRMMKCADEYLDSGSSWLETQRQLRIYGALGMIIRAKSAARVFSGGSTSRPRS